jgi:hypothetical protein
VLGGWDYGFLLHTNLLYIKECKIITVVKHGMVFIYGGECNLLNSQACLLQAPTEVLENNVVI